jgi:hypothetical protein
MQDAYFVIMTLMKLAGETERQAEHIDAQQFLLQARVYKE